MLELIGIEKRYGTRTVLSIDRFAFAPGVRTCIIGGNGAGKSTLLRILAGTLSPEKGGQIVRPEGLRVAYMPQKPYPFAKSVLQNVLLGVREGDRQQRRQKAEQAIEAVGLQAFTAQRGDRLSGGEMQRMAFARTIADRHDVLILNSLTRLMQLLPWHTTEKCSLSGLRSTRPVPWSLLTITSSCKRLAKPLPAS